MGRCVARALRRRFKWRTSLGYRRTKEYREALKFVEKGAVCVIQVPHRHLVGWLVGWCAIVQDSDR